LSGAPGTKDGATASARTSIPPTDGTPASPTSRKKATRKASSKPVSQIAHQRGHLQIADREPRQVGHGYPDHFQLFPG
jgi:hypothetical protein